MPVTENPLDLIYSKEERFKQMKNANLFDQHLAAFILSNKKVTEYIIQVLMNDTTLSVKDVRTEDQISKITSKTVRLDALVEDKNGKLYEVEIQHLPEPAPERRTRYYAGVIDSEFLAKGVDYEHLPDVYFFYISEKDIFKLGETVSKVNKTLGSSNLTYDDGLHISYINATINDGSKIAKLMHFFKTTDENDLSQGALSEYVHKLKTGKVDDKIMDAFLQKFYDGGFNRGHSEGKLEGKIETAKNMLLKNLPLDIIASCTNLSLTEIQQLQKTMQ